MATTTHFPSFEATTVILAVWKAAGWIRSEILIDFLFFTSKIRLPGAEKNGFQ